jgi:hypothetical protein
MRWGAGTLAIHPPHGSHPPHACVIHTHRPHVCALTPHLRECSSGALDGDLGHHASSGFP